MADMFNNNQNGEWYFYNQAIKAKGYNDFKSRWGNRPNVDFWEAQSMINRQITGLTPASNLQLNGAERRSCAPARPHTNSPSPCWMALPLTPEKMKISRDSVENAMFTLGKALQDYIPDYQVRDQNI